MALGVVMVSKWVGTTRENLLVTFSPPHQSDRTGWYESTDWNANQNPRQCSSDRYGYAADVIETLEIIGIAGFYDAGPDDYLLCDQEHAGGYYEHDEESGDRYAQNNYRYDAHDGYDAGEDVCYDYCEY